MEVNKAEYFCSLINGDEFDLPFLSEVLDENPWFSMAAALLIRDLKEVSNVERSGELRRDYALAFSSNSYSATSSFLRFRKLQQSQDSSSLDIINSFLDKSPKKIKIEPEDTPYFEDDINEEVAEVGEPIVSEQFAEILIAQGHFERAKEIYLKLSLKNPEKSVYFAQLIEKIEKI